MIRKTRNSKWFKGVIIIQLICLLNLSIFPVPIFALTGGPSQPEVQGFEPIGTTEMVNLFTGDFKYNIPLLDVGGYPINLSYQGGIGMDQEASWTGLGWSLTAGVLNRAMRGLPDDFKGDQILKEMNVRPQRVFGGNLTLGNIEVVGLPILDLSAGIGAFYNNYKGIGFERSLDVNIGIGNKQKGKLNIGLGLTANSQEGIGINPSMSLSIETDKFSSMDNGYNTFSANIGSSYNSRSGLQALSFGASVSSFQTNGKQGNEMKMKGRSTMPINGGASIPLSLQTYTPEINLPMSNSSNMLHAGVGLEAYWVNGKGRLSGYFNEQKLQFKRQKTGGYGYLYAEEGQNRPFALMDFNREKDGSFTRNTPSLPLTNFTYDAFNISAQGIAGMYRPFRADVGTVFDNKVMSFSNSKRIGVDFGSANIAKGGANGGFNFNVSSSGNWTDSNPAGEGLAFRTRNSISSNHFHTYEPYYFKQAGEMVPVDDHFHNQLGNADPVRVEITDEGNVANLKRKTSLSSTSEQNLAIPGNKTDREKRNQVFSILTAREASHFALDKTIKSYRFTNFQTGEETITSIGRTDIAEDHHLSELTVLRPNGARYVFGIPAYNLKQRDVSFNVSGVSNCATGLVAYTSNSDNSVNNQKGLDRYFSATELPPFAHSYLLTGVLSPDYVDRTGNGITDDDFGNYTKLCYQKSDETYHWRVPFKKDTANFNEGLKADTEDDKASYTYGERENWYLHAIETKTHRAEFYTSDRKDGYGVMDENGGLNPNNPVQRLDSIKLFARWDRLNNKANAEVIKAVHFRYSYKLCPHVPNNIGAPELVDGINVNANRGKLTLEEVFFTYGKSRKGKLSPYHFYYGDTDFDGNPESTLNPDYHLKGYDRWGNYKPNSANSCAPLDPQLSNAEFPYVDQNKSSADLYAAVWSMNGIQLPSGGFIKVKYEADDYAYVQDKKAMQMIEVTGMGKEISGLNPGSSELYTSSDEHLYLKIALPQAVSSQVELREQYFVDEEKRELKSMYFRFLIDLIGKQNGMGNNPDAYEYVSGYADIESFGMISSNEAWIRLKPVPIGDKPGGKPINPILKTAFQFARLHLSKMVYPGSDPGNGQLKNVIQGLLSFMMDLRTMATGFNRTLQDWNFCKEVFLPKSRIRLYCPTYSNNNEFSHSKLGGGARVSKVTISDSWADMVEHGNTFEYGQEYFYTTLNEFGEKISSGVAEYEPMIGAEENPFRQQVAFTEEHKMAPDNQFYKETPFGESFFPSPNVGYSEVIVRNLQHTGVKRNATGLVQHLFYTAKDFPVYTDQTKLETKSAKPSWLKKILKKDIKERMVASQGFAIYLNNMHGQQKGQWVYPEYPEGTPVDEYKPISGVEYFYQTQTGNPKRLHNEVKAISKTGAISTVTVGKEIDLVSDMRENKSQMAGFTFAFNLDVSLFPFPPAPVPIPSVWPTFTKEETLFRSTSMTKVVTRYGILEKTVAYDLGSRVSTENLAFDAETGELLVTKTQNDFEDPVYNYTYPAHLAYAQGMGMAYKNLGVLFEGSDYAYSSGNLTFNGIYEPSYFTKGDELSANNTRLWVVAVNANNIQVVNITGNAPGSISGPLKIIRSGRKNMQVTAIGTITSKENPIAGGHLHTFSETDKILNAGAVEFTDEWNGFCECGIDINDEVGLKNPYILGWKGNWRPWRSMLFLTGRTQANLNRNTNIREDGIYTRFDPYWLHNGLGHWNANSGALGGFNNWTFTSEVTLFSPFGFELENRDALDRFSAATYGFNQNLPTAVASNARYSEIGFDSFEDYDCKSCTDDHFSFSESTPIPNISKTESHSGYRSIAVAPGDSVLIRKVIVPCDSLDNKKGLKKGGKFLND